MRSIAITFAVHGGRTAGPAITIHWAHARTRLGWSWAPCVIAAILKPLAHFVAELLHAFFCLSDTLFRIRGSVMKELWSRSFSACHRRHHRMPGMFRDNRHHTFSEPGGNPHLRTFSADGQIHFVAFLMSTHQGLKLLGVHDALVTQHHNDIVLLHT
jgi:hypothetical protein